VDSPKDLPLLSNTAWLTVFAVSYVIHFAEEFWCGGGYRAYLLRLRGVEMSQTMFIVLQSIGLALLVTAAIVAPPFGFAELALVIISTTFLASGFTHTFTAISDRGYGPGLIVSLLWVPLGAAMLVWLYDHMQLSRYFMGISIGACAHIAIVAGTMVSERIKKQLQALSDR